MVLNRNCESVEKAFTTDKTVWDLQRSSQKKVQEGESLDGEDQAAVLLFKPLCAMTDLTGSALFEVLSCEKSKVALRIPSLTRQLQS